MIPRLLNVFIHSLRTPLLKNAPLLCQGWGGKTCLIFLPCGVTAERAVSVLRGPCRTEFPKPVCFAGFEQKGSLLLDFVQTGPLRISPPSMSAWVCTYMCPLCLSTPSTLGFPKGLWLYCWGGDKLVNRPTGVSIATLWFISQWSASRVFPACLRCLSRESAIKRGLRTYSIRMKGGHWGDWGFPGGVF